MKIFIVLLAFLALAVAVEEITPFAPISDSVKKAIEDIRDQMPCGFESKGIPPLAPLELKHKEIAFSTPDFKVSGTVDDFKLNGLNDFEVDLMKINAVLQKANFRLIFKNINVDTLYNLDALLQKAGVTVVLKGHGQAKVAVKDIVINGFAKFSYSVLSQKLKLKTFDLRIKIGQMESAIEGIMGQGKINRKMNKLLEQTVEDVINSSEDMIAHEIEDMVVPMVNAYLADKKLSELVGGGSGGEKVPCNPAK